MLLAPRFVPGRQIRWLKRCALRADSRPASARSASAGDAVARHSCRGSSSRSLSRQLHRSEAWDRPSDTAVRRSCWNDRERVLFSETAVADDVIIRIPLLARDLGPPHLATAGIVARLGACLRSSVAQGETRMHTHPGFALYPTPRRIADGARRTSPCLGERRKRVHRFLVECHAAASCRRVAPWHRGLSE